MTAGNDEVTVIFQPMNRVVQLPRGSTVLDAIRLAAIRFESICGGKGECGKCRVIHVRGRHESDPSCGTHTLSPTEIAGNYCLACRTTMAGDCEFTIPVESRIDSPQILIAAGLKPDELSPSVTKYLTSPGDSAHHPGHRSVRLEGYAGSRPHMTRAQQDRIQSSGEPLTVTVGTATGYPEVIAIENGNRTDSNFGIAIDLGTTTVVGILMNLADGSACGSASVLNRQITYGEELITRIVVARDKGGLLRLQQAAVGSINAVIDQLCSDAGIEPTAIGDITVAGNTVMNYLILGRDPHTLELVNADVTQAPSVVKAGSLGLHTNPNASVYCLPNVSRFVGGDAIGDVIASGMHRSADLSLMIDLGTNGEIVFGNRDWLASASCASGPAFEGAGIAEGVRAMKGAIEHVAIDPVTGAVTVTTIGGTVPKGICGSGIIDAAAGMAAAGIIDFTGKIQPGAPGVRAGEKGLEFVLVPKEKTATGRDIVITSPDMAYLIDSKAAACGAIGVLMKKYHIGINDVRHVYLAGAFGAYMDMTKVIAFGIIPDFPRAEFHHIGNGSLAGARATLLSRKKRDEALEIAKKMAYIDLLAESDFIEEYTAAIYIPGKKEYFPGPMRD
jgi:uncharacterized 2Fe-2S/4Fe-4S cluster protein (DUF4445 family)